ncbi:MAG: hypothetical protein KJO06_04850 [Gemmatimonadetes bacterium]|nr:hypothetical protein [Gemmatimonadota bacterium]
MKWIPGGSAGMVVVLAAMGLGACSSDSSDLNQPAEPEVQLLFTPASVSFGEDRSRAVELRNTGADPAGPVELAALAVTDAGGNAVPGAGLSVSPSEVATLNPGASRALTLTLDVPASVSGGNYQVALEARVDGQAVATLGSSFAVVQNDGPVIATLDITGGAAQARQGEVLSFEVVATDDQGQAVDDPMVTWRAEPAFSGLATADGDFVAYSVGTTMIIAEAGGAADTADLEVTSRNAPSGSFEVEWHEPIELRYTSDHWEHGDVAYTGTWGCRAVAGGQCGNTLYVWDITTRNAPFLTDSVRVDARVVNDVKVREDGTLAIITHEASNDGLNGITLLDLADPKAPVVITRFVAPDLAPGIHNVWIDGDYAYLVVDGAVPSSGLRVLDISDPANPQIVASFYGGGSFLHDVYVRDGLAFLSHWSTGLVILDVGNGIAGGSPINPVEVSRIAIPGYEVHNAWYWPESGYVFLGDEIRVPGTVRVVDVNDLASPREVASFTLAGAAPHNFWVDEAAGIAYFSWYENGVHAVDVSGRLLGELDKQARQVASIQYDVGGACVSTSGTCSWAPQLHDGFIYVSDLNSGLWVLRPTF